MFLDLSQISTCRDILLSCSLLYPCGTIHRERQKGGGWQVDRERIKDPRWAEDLRKFHNLFFCVLPKTSFHSCLSLSPKIAFLYYTAHYPLFLILDFFSHLPVFPLMEFLDLLNLKVTKVYNRMSDEESNFRKHIIMLARQNTE